MYVGVILLIGSIKLLPSCIPHVCGGDPGEYRMLVDYTEYSPCMWG